MNIKFVSTGGVFDYKIGNSSAIIESPWGNILIDCGYTVYPKLEENHLIDKIDYVLITHLHGDHVGSIHPLILNMVNRCGKIVKIICPTNNFKSLLRKSLEIFLINVDKYVEFVDIHDFQGMGYIDTTNCHVEGMESFAYYFKDNEQFIYYSGDLGDIGVTERFLNTVDHQNIVVFHETSFIQGKAHVYYRDLMRFIHEHNYDVYAYHCNHVKAPIDCTLKFVAEQDQFHI